MRRLSSPVLAQSQLFGPKVIYYKSGHAEGCRLASWAAVRLALFISLITSYLPQLFQL